MSDFFFDDSKDYAHDDAFGIQEPRYRPAVSPGKVTLTSRIPRAAPAPSSQPVQRKSNGQPQSGLRSEVSDWMNVAFRPDLHSAPEESSTVALIQRKQEREPEETTSRPQPSGSGSPLPEDVRTQMEEAFGADFSAVRIHEGHQAAAVGALAYTQGTNLHFQPGQYSPHSRRGRELLGHELTHVVQQSQGRVKSTTQAKGVEINDDSSLEREADEMGTKAARGERVNLGGPRSISPASREPARPMAQLRALSLLDRFSSRGFVADNGTPVQCARLRDYVREDTDQATSNPDDAAIRQTNEYNSFMDPNLVWQWKDQVTEEEALLACRLILQALREDRSVNWQSQARSYLEQARAQLGTHQRAADHNAESDAENQDFESSSLPCPNQTLQSPDPTQLSDDQLDAEIQRIEEELNSTSPCQTDTDALQETLTMLQAERAERTRLAPELDRIAAKYRAMIADARGRGYDVAADNLQRFLDGTGGTKTIAVSWLRGFGPVISAEETNQSRFESSLQNIAAELSDGETRSFSDHWDRRLTGGLTTELYYASGTSTLTSTGSFSLRRSGSRVTISGSVEHHWWDPYDWHAGLSAYIPGHGNISDEDALKIQRYRGARPFDMEADWSQTVDGSITVRDYWFDSTDLEWSGP